MSEVERLDGYRRRLLWLSLVSIVLWLGGDLLARLLAQAEAAPVLRKIALLVAVPASFVWGYHLIQVVRFNRRVAEDPALSEALNDELTRFARTRGWVVGFWSMLAVQAPLLFAGMPAELGARLTILVGVTASLAGYLRAARATG